MTVNVIIRPALENDAESIAEFNSLLSTETEDSSLPIATAKAGVLSVLDDTSRGRYWVADLDGRLVGQTLVTFEWSDWRDAMLWWIQSVYVHPDFRRKGVFSALYKHVESLARKEPRVCGIRLYVEGGNETAQRTYDALGMSMTNYRVMERLFTGENRC